MNPTALVSKLLDLPYAPLALLIGAVLVLAPCIDIQKGWTISSHAPTASTPILAGVGLVLISAALVGHPLLRETPSAVSAGLDTSQVQEEGAIPWTEIGQCQIRVVNGEIVMPLMGSGYGGISPPRALVGLLLAVAEAVRTFRGRKPSRVTIVVFKKGAESKGLID